ncbi:VOC family protein [Nocardiopsis sp. N85]|uniref:VOC family protein n=1 Tax=Nocardiopsis sp. N85 TaxID=3029400 RepID=UPI00237EF4FE|nr:VOC family protein [Nocardiopsis sp. N85]MDE3725137.1 VOC family protein [Nocardiopsis sp. N85]
MITTDFLPGSPCWVEVSSPDVDASATFYRRVFGWEAISEGGPEAAGYLSLKLAGDIVAGLCPTISESERPGWTVFFHDPDVDGTAVAVERLGGTVLIEPFDVLHLGRTAQFFDPQGARFAVWHPAAFPGVQRTDAPGSLCRVELWTPDGPGSVDFYGELFRWSYTDFDLPGESGHYRVVTPAGADRDRDQGGVMALLPEQVDDAEGSAAWNPVFMVADADTAVGGVRAGGGQVYMGPEDTPGVGRVAACADPFGAGFVLLAPPRE